MSRFNKRRRGEAAEVETGAMNDIMFFLFLFFLIASTLAGANAIQINLPSAKKGVTKMIQMKIVNVTVDKESKIFIDQDEVTFDELEPRLRALKEKYIDPENKDLSKLNIVLRLDKDISIQKAVDVMQVGANLGVKMVLGINKNAPTGK